MSQTPTAARVFKADSSHWYYPSGLPCYELPKKDGSGNKTPTLADARKLWLVPSVTTILKVLHKEGLVNWMIEQACLAVLTSPRQEAEPLDAFVERILKTERVQDQESTVARDRGTQIHEAMELLFNGEPISNEIEPWVRPAFEKIRAMGPTIATEKILVGPGYAGKTDYVQKLGINSAHSVAMIWDFKSAGKLPDKGAWWEHRLQLAAYAKAYCLEAKLAPDQVYAANCYISTKEQGRFVIAEHNNWFTVYEDGFAPLVRYWSCANGYNPLSKP
jgi:hypothetical protein